MCLALVPEAVPAKFRLSIEGNSNKDWLAGGAEISAFVVEPTSVEFGFAAQSTFGLGTHSLEVLWHQQQMARRIRRP